MRSLPKLTAATLLPAALLVSLVTRADGDPAEVAAARALVEQASAAMADKRWDVACPKLEEALKLEKGALATKLALAICYEGAGKSASAWALYLQVDEAAGRAGQADAQKDAHDRAEALRPKLAQLRIVVTDEEKDFEGLVIHRDGKVVPRPLWNTLIPVDKGVHTVVVEAKGKQTREKHVTVDADGASVDFEIPPMREEGLPPPPVTPPPDASSGAIPVVGGSKDLSMRRGIPQLHIEEPTKQLMLYRVNLPAFPGAASDAVVCVVPCDEAIDGSAGQEFYLGGVGITTSSRFRLTEKAGKVGMKAEPGRLTSWLAGAWMSAFGTAGVAVGAPVLAIGATNAIDNKTGVAAGVGAGMMVTGAVLLAVGIPLLLSGRTTYSFEEPAAVRF